MWMSTRGGEGGLAHVDACGQRGQKPDFFCGRHKWMAPIHVTRGVNQADAHHNILYGHCAHKSQMDKNSEV